MTDSELGKALDSIIIIVDTREKKNKHILDYFDKYKIPYKIAKVDSGDYTYVMDSKYQLDGKVCVERKNSWDEISQNFTKNRARFINEFERAGDTKIHIVIENASWLTLFRGSYRSKLPPKSFIASLFTWNARYNSPIWLVSKNESPVVIYNVIKYGVRELLKNS